MKRKILCASLLLSLAMGVVAQSSEKAGAQKRQPTQQRTTKNVGANTIFNNKNAIRTDVHTVLNSTGTYNAYGSNRTAARQLPISDPVIRMLNERMNLPSPMDVPGSGILGMPKLTYGVANGHILFRSTDAPTLGTGTGSGSVGTGTNVGSVGASGNALGVNGKSPYAGPGIYGIPIKDENFVRSSKKGSRPKGLWR